MNVPLDYRTEVIIKRIYHNNEIFTIPKKELKEMLILCTKNIHFLYCNDIYRRRHRVAMGTPLGPAIAGVNLKKQYLHSQIIYLHGNDM